MTPADDNFLFHPCPAHFPDLWKQKTLWKLEPTPKQINDMKKMYLMPEDGTEDAIKLCQIWGVKSIEDIARAYARSWCCDPHDFLVLRGQLANGSVIEGLAELRWTQNYLQEDLSACFSRAKDFGVSEKHRRRGFAEGMGHSQETVKYCCPAAKKTWPFQNTKEIDEKFSQFVKGENAVSARYFIPWFIVEKFKL